MRARRILIESLPVLMLVTCISTFAGYILNSTLSFGEIIAILIITPAILSTGGNVGTSFGARITTQLHSGLIEPRFRRINLVFINFIAIFLAGLLVSVFIGVMGFILSILINPLIQLTIFDFLTLTLAAGALDYGIVLFLSLFTAFISFRKGLDPDNLVAPIITTLADLIGITAIYSVLNLLL